MTIHTPKEVLLGAFRQKLLPPKRMSEADTLLVDIATLCAKAQNIADLREPLASLLGDIIHEIQLEKTSRTHPGMIGTLAPECEFASITE
jgi:hypothetical protein